jgi:hypothetical protein
MVTKGAPRPCATGSPGWAVRPRESGGRTGDDVHLSGHLLLAHLTNKPLFAQPGERMASPL